LKNLARILSIIFHPSLIPTCLVLIFFENENFLALNFERKKILFLIIFLTTFLMPVFSLPFFYFTKNIKSLEMKSHKERFLPLLISSVFYLLGIFLLKIYLFEKILSDFLISAFIILIFSAFISLKWKISLHLSGMGSLFASIIILIHKFNFNLKLLLIVVFFMTFVIAWARLELKAHNILQIIYGFFFAFLFILFFFNF